MRLAEGSVVAGLHLHLLLVRLAVHVHRVRDRAVQLLLTHPEAHVRGGGNFI